MNKKPTKFLDRVVKPGALARMLLTATEYREPHSTLALPRYKKSTLSPREAIRLAEKLTSTGQKPLTGREKRFLAMNFIAEAQGREEYQEKATVDSLTGLLNRRHFDVLLERAVSTVKREQENYTEEKDRRAPAKRVLLMIDLAGLKAINDQIAPAAGDAAIKRMGEILKGAAREEEGAFRVGGDEFAMILVGRGRAGQDDFSDQAVERLEGVFEQHGYFEYNSQWRKLNVYIAKQPIDGSNDAEEISRLAGEKLNEAKAAAKHDRTQIDLTPQEL